MGSKNKNTAERGKFKQELHSALYKSDEIKELLLGDISDMPTGEVKKQFKERVKSHLFIDDTIKDTGSYIFYDIRMPRLSSNIKDCQVILYAICHRDILDSNYSKDGYFGNRVDVLSQLIEDCLINDESVSENFGIGKLTLDSVDIYNAMRFYGVLMKFSVPNFR